MKSNSANGGILRKAYTFVLVGTMAANVVMTSSQTTTDAFEGKRVASVGLGDYTDEDVKKYRRELMARITFDKGESEYLKTKSCKPKVYTKGYNTQKFIRAGYRNC